jgi:hypothetical protein
MQDAQGQAVEGLQLLAAEAVMEPDALEEAFRGMGGVALTQKEGRFILRPPAGVEIGVGFGHACLFSGGRAGKSRPDFAQN